LIDGHIHPLHQRCHWKPRALPRQLASDHGGEAQGRAGPPDPVGGICKQHHTISLEKARSTATRRWRFIRSLMASTRRLSRLLPCRASKSVSSLCGRRRRASSTTWSTAWWAGRRGRRWSVRGRERVLHSGVYSPNARHPDFTITPSNQYASCYVPGIPLTPLRVRSTPGTGEKVRPETHGQPPSAFGEQTAGINRFRTFIQWKGHEAPRQMDAIRWTSL
jgi:hypothetical protein